MASTVGAATPRREQQVTESLSRGRKTLPRCARKRQITNNLRWKIWWERQRRDANSKSPTAPVGAGSPSHDARASAKSSAASVGKSRGSGNAATRKANHRKPLPRRPMQHQVIGSLSRGKAPPTMPALAPNHQQPQSGQEAPPTTPAQAPNHQQPPLENLVGAATPRREQQITESPSHDAGASAKSSAASV